MGSSFLRKPVEVDCRQGWQDRIDVFFENIYAGFYGTALRLVQEDPELAVTRYVNDETALHALARNPSAYASRSVGFLRKVVNFFIGLKFIGKSDSTSNQALELLQFVWKEIMRRQDINAADFIRKPSDLLFDAAKLGDFQLLAVLLRPCPGLAGELDGSLRSIFHVAVLHLRVKILSLIDEIGFDEDLLAIVDNEKNSILHLAAKCRCVSSNISSAVLEMQQELLSFREVEMMMPPSLREMKNAEGLTASELFSIEHKHLPQRAQQHMRSTTTSLACAGFCVPVIFKALVMITKTIPLQANATLLRLFAISMTTVAFFSYSICVLMCLWIIMSSHEEKDFLVSSPLKYMAGMGALCTILIYMAMIYSTIFYIRLQGTSSWLPWFNLLPVLVLATLPEWLVVPLLKDLFYATYRGWCLSKQRKR